METIATTHTSMTISRKVLSLLLVGALVVLAGCDQTEQNIQPDYGDRYIISLGNSVVGDASGVDINASTATVTAPDTVSYFVQGFTTEKNYTWTLNGEELPVEERSESSYVRSRRDGEFVTIVFSQEDPFANVNPGGSATNTLRVNSPDDNINAEEIEISTEVPSFGEQVVRLGSLGYSALVDLASASGVASVLTDGSTYTLFAPTDAVLGGLETAPTQATDPDEPASSSVLGDILKYHALAADVASGDISDGQTAATLLGNQTVSFSTTNGVSINDGQASVVNPDVPATGGAIHGIDGVLLPSTASVDFTDRETETLAAGDTVTVDGSYIGDQGGYIVLHDSTSLANGNVIGSIVGHSDYIAPNSIANEVAVPLDASISDTTTIGAMAHRDNGNETYDFETSGGTQDAPYTLDGSAVIDYGVLDVSAE
jgi:uncharacterized surface protein with fasciclin (FAS1) repeats